MAEGGQEQAASRWLDDDSLAMPSGSLANHKGLVQIA